MTNQKQLLALLIPLELMCPSYNSLPFMTLKSRGMPSSPQVDDKLLVEDVVFCNALSAGQLMLLNTIVEPDDDNYQKL